MSLYERQSQKSSSIRDGDWVPRAFNVTPQDILTGLDRFRTLTTATLSFTDTSLGGNFAINNPPQFTRYADLKASSFINRNRGYDGLVSRGKGRAYTEMIDEQRQLVHFRFGTSQYNGLATFFTGFYNNSAGILAREGRFAQLTFAVGQLIGAVVSLPFTPFILIGSVARFLIGRPSSKYYYLKPGMAMYWNRVQFISNAMAANLGIVPRAFDNPDPATAATLDDVSVAYTNEYLSLAHKVASDIFTSETGGIDVYKVANKAQRLANINYEQLQKMYATAGTALDLQNQLIAYQDTFVMTDPGGEGLPSLLNRYFGSVLGDIHHRQAIQTSGVPTSDKSDGTQPAPNTAGGGSAPAADPAANVDASQVSPTSVTDSDPNMKDYYVLAAGSDATSAIATGVSTAWNKVAGWGQALVNDSHSGLFQADVREGSGFVTFGVDYGGSVGESFSSSVGESTIAQRFNQFSQAGRAKRFDFAGGETGIGVIDGITSAAGALVAGTMDGLHISGLLSLAGSAYVDIPKMYQDSSSSLPPNSFTMQLRCPYGNKLARYMYLYIPLAYLLAGALPISTGKQSYTAPFLCEMYSRGRNQVKLGMITSLTVTRGVGNTGFNNKTHMLSLDVQFEVTDLSSVMHVPIDTFSITQPWNGIFDDDNIFNDYLAAICSLSMADQIYPLRALSINLSKAKLNVNSYFSLSHMSNVLNNSQTGLMLGPLILAATGQHFTERASGL